jgi:hypothetical protein
LVKLLKKDRRGEPCCREGRTNAGEFNIWEGMSTDADRFEAFVRLRNDEGDGLGDVGALDGAGRVVRWRKELDHDETHV